MPLRRSSVQRSPPKRDQSIGTPGRSSMAATGGPAGGDLSRSYSARLDHLLPAKVVVPVRLVRSNSSANHSTSRRQLTNTPPRKAHPSEMRYSNQSWKERRQEAEVEDLSSVTQTPVEPIVATRASLVGVLTQSARSSSNKSVLALVQAASATVNAIANSAPPSISEAKEESMSPPSTVTHSPQHQSAPSLPSAWHGGLQTLLVTTNVLCLAANATRLWTRLSAPSTPGFQAVLPASAFASSLAERVMRGALWEVSFAGYHCVSILRLLMNGNALLRRSNRVVPLDTSASSLKAIQRIKISSQSSATTAVALQDRAATTAVRATDDQEFTMLGWLMSVLRLRLKLVAYGNDDGEAVDSWTYGSCVLLVTNWILQLCIAAGMSAALPMSPSTPREFYATLIVVNMWVLPVLYRALRRFKSRWRRGEIDHFFHLLWLASSLAITVIGLAIIPLAVFHDQCRRGYNASSHRFDDTKRLDAVWMTRANLVVDWLVTTAAGPSALRVIAGLCVVVTGESIRSALVEDAARDQRLQALAQQQRRLSNTPRPRVSSLTNAIPDLVSVQPLKSSGSKWHARWRAVQKTSSPRRLAFALALTLGIIAIAGHSSSVRTNSLPDSCALQLRPWFDAHASCAMLDVFCSSDAATTLNDLVPLSLPPSQLQFLSIRACSRLEVTSLLTEMPSLVALTLVNTSVVSWSSPLSILTHPNLRMVTMVDATVAGLWMDANQPPKWIGELLSCGNSSKFLPVTDAQREQMPLLEIPSS